MSDLDLELVPTDDLVQELANRTDHGLICLFREGELGPEHHSVIRHWWGIHHLAIGLAQEMKYIILEDLQDGMHPIKNGR